MALVFPVQPGRVAVLREAQYEPGFPMALEGLAAGQWFAGLRGIVTNVSGVVGEHVNVQPSLGDTIYVVAHGARPAQITLGGLAFTRGACMPGLQESSLMSGIEGLMGYYRAQRASARGLPLRLQVGTTAAGRWSGHLVGLNFQASNPEVPVLQFGLQFLLHFED